MTGYQVALSLAVGVATVFGFDKVAMLNMMDSVLSCGAVTIVGLGLCRLITEKVLRPHQHVAVLLVGLAFLCWGIPQLPFIWFFADPDFWYVLAAGKTIAGLAALLVSIYLLDPKPEYRGPISASVGAHTHSVSGASLP